MKIKSEEQVKYEQYCRHLLTIATMSGIERHNEKEHSGLHKDCNICLPTDGLDYDAIDKMFAK